MKTPLFETFIVNDVRSDGFFIAHTASGLSPHVFYTDIGENLSGEIFKRKRKLWCRNFTVSSNVSSFRTEPTCIHFTQCGGCDLRHLTYERQLSIKSLIAEKLLGVWPEHVIESPTTDHYRNYAAFNIEYGKTGFYRKMSRSLLDIEECLLMDNVINNELPSIHAIKADFEGEIRIKTCDSGIIRRDYPKFVSKEATKESLRYAQKTIDGIPYFVSPDTFFQSNDGILPAWLRTIERYVNVRKTPGTSLIDLYSGAGTISLWLARSVGDVIGIENNPLAVFLATRSIEIMGFDATAVRYETGDLNSYDITHLNADILVVNPPRGGLSDNVIRYIREKKFASVIYSSCNIASFARDVFALHEYGLSEYTLVDMFPHTFHFETVGLLTRKEEHHG